MNVFDFIEIALKLLVVFICVILFLKITGKTSISQMNSIDFIGNMVLGGIAGGIIYNPSITILDFLIVLVLWTTIMYLSNYLKQRSQKAKAFIVGNPIILIEKGKINLAALTNANLDMSGLSTQLRMKGILTINHVEKAIFEPNGQLTIIEKGKKDIAYIVVENEKPRNNALEELGKDEQWLKNKLKGLGYNSYDGLYCVEFYDNHLAIIPCETEPK